MGMREITVRVDSRAAEFYISSSEQQRRKLDAWLSLCLSEFAANPRPLQEIISEASEEAQASGLTMDGLNQILKEP